MLLLRYCAWCGEYQGVTTGEGHQIRKNICEVDTATICPACFARLVKDFQEQQQLRT
jgi:hypothetical protein